MFAQSLSLSNTASKQVTLPQTADVSRVERNGARVSVLIQHIESTSQLSLIKLLVRFTKESWETARGNNDKPAALKSPQRNACP